jgi:hypothetical protein
MGVSAAPPGREMMGVVLGPGACAAELPSGVPAGTGMVVSPVGKNPVASLELQLEPEDP